MSYTPPAGNAVALQFSLAYAVPAGNAVNLQFADDPFNLGSGIRHRFSNPKANGADTTITRPGDWNEEHVIQSDQTTNVVPMTTASPVSSDRPDIEFRRSRGSLSAPAAVTVNDYLGFVRWRAYNTTLVGYSFVADIFAQADGAPNGNFVPGRLIFSTSDGTGNPVERGRFDKSGNLGLGNAVPGAASTGYFNAYWGPSSTILADNTTGANKSFQHSQNAEFVGGAWKYINTDKAVQFVLNNGQIIFRVAASGAAGAALTWTNAVTIDNAGMITAISHVRSAGVVRAEGGGGPTGAAGVGCELGNDGSGNAYVQAFNRTTSAYVPLDFYGSTYMFSGAGGVAINLASATYMLDTGGRARSYTNIVDQLPGGGYFGLDQAGATITLANNATYDIPNFSGLLILNDISVTGQAAVYLVATANVILIAQTGAQFIAGAAAAGKVSVGYNAGTASYRITNQQGNAMSIGLGTLRTRAAP